MYLGLISKILFGSLSTLHGNLLNCFYNKSIIPPFFILLLSHWGMYVPSILSHCALLSMLLIIHSDYRHNYEYYNKNYPVLSKTIDVCLIIATILVVCLIFVDIFYCIHSIFTALKDFVSGYILKTGEEGSSSQTSGKPGGFGSGNPDPYSRPGGGGGGNNGGPGGPLGP